jgi:hypothetical protein
MIMKYLLKLSMLILFHFTFPASSNSPISSNGGGPPPPRAIGRAIAGVLSGAAANLRSRFNILGQQQMTSSGNKLLN